MRIMAKKGVTVANKQFLVGQEIKYTKGSILENKISKKHNFSRKNIPKFTDKHPYII